MPRLARLLLLVALVVASGVTVMPAPAQTAGGRVYLPVSGGPAPGRSRVAQSTSPTRIYFPMQGGGRAAPSSPTPTPAPRSDARQFGYGASVADLGRHGGTVKSMGFGYVKSYLAWEASEPARGQYQWLTAPSANDANNIARDAERHGLKLVVRVDGSPRWAAPGSGTRPPTNPADYGDFMGALAAYLKGRVVAYEIWNEPNLAVEWGGQPPNPEQYTRLLQDAYRKIKAADPNALVISAGLATTGGDGGATALDDLQFIRRMYAAGAKGSFDALGSHPYGFSTAPAVRNANRVTDFLRAADQYQVMVENGDGERAIWATEIGWLADPAAFGQPGLIDDPLWAGRQWQRVDPDTQARYLVEAYQYAAQRWPWMGVMLLFNLDFSTVGYYPPAEPMRWYAVLNPDGGERPAVGALRAMPKPVR